MFTTAYHTMIDRIRKKKHLSDYTEVTEDSLFHTEQYSDLETSPEQSDKSSSGKTKSGNYTQGL
ncbi:MAG: hypothetical protein IPJ66_16100 [Bacteroidetes bacterium]|nr:hypothetical protein [Bacteroidota bacterium]